MCTRLVCFATRGVLPLVAVMFLVALAPHAKGASPSELLEKAIYTEETVGNLDEAMKLYEQVVAEGKAGHQTAAQAQYRLALCYLKKDKQAEAMAAFQKLIEDYPSEKELIVKAQKHLPSKLKLLPAPWTDGERLQLDMKLPAGLDIGTMIYMIDKAEHDGKKVWRCSTRGLVTINDASSYSTVLCDEGNFAPVTSHWKHSLLGEADAVYSDTSVEIKVVGKNDPITIEYAPPVFDNEQGVELFRRLPLAIGYKTTISIVTSLGGNKIEIPVSVPATETLTVPAGTFACYKLELGVVGQTFWISTDEHRYVVRFAAGGVTADLTKIEQTEPGKEEKVSGDDFSLTLPAGWLSYAPTNEFKKEKGKTVYLLDSRADARLLVNAQAKQTLKDEERESPRAWTESFVSDIKKVFTDFQVREAGLSDKTVGGLPATVMVADFTRDGKKTSMVGVAVFGDKSAATLRLTAAAEKFDQHRGAFDKVVESFELK